MESAGRLSEMTRERYLAKSAGGNVEGTRAGLCLPDLRDGCVGVCGVCGVCGTAFPYGSREVMSKIASNSRIKSGCL